MGAYTDKIVNKREAGLFYDVLGVELFTDPRDSETIRDMEGDDGELVSSKERLEVVNAIENDLEINDQMTEIRIPHNFYVIEELVWWLGYRTELFLEDLDDWRYDDNCKDPASVVKKKREVVRSSRSLKAKILDVYDAIK